jgi:hypothetical protein
MNELNTFPPEALGDDAGRHEVIHVHDPPHATSLRSIVGES